MGAIFLNIISSNVETDVNETLCFSFLRLEEVNSIL